MVLFEKSRIKQIFQTNTRFILFLMVLFGGISEAVQYSFISGREGNVFDLLADIFGLIMGLVAFQIIINFLTNKKTTQ